MARDEEELLSFALDGEALPDAARTPLEQCATCQQRLARYEQASAYLISHLYRSQCPTGEQISLYCADLLPENERTRIPTHVLECPLCPAEVEDTRRFLQVSDIELPVPSLSPLNLLPPIFTTRVCPPHLQSSSP